MKVYLGLGSNMGDRFDTLSRAVDSLRSEAGFTHLDVSPVYETIPADMPGQPQFLNAAVFFETSLDPHGVLDVCGEIEITLGRVRTVKGAPRTIDIDIELYGDHVIESETLTIPHPRLHLRDFVLQPLIDIQPSLIHPKLDTPLKTILSELGIRYIMGRHPETL